MKANILFQNDEHTVLTFTDLVTGEGIQSNQMVIIREGHSAIFDPGGDLTYMPLSMAINKFVKVKDIDYIIATHQDPDIISSLDKWLMYSDAKIVISCLWERFVPHLVPGYMKEKAEGRLIAIPDQGMDIQLAHSVIKAIPAHFLHSVGNFQFYDPISKILFSGDAGASLVDTAPERPVRNFDKHVNKMLGFHQRYMVSNKICRLWVNMVRDMDVEIIVPQHGRPFVGKEMIGKFLDWFETLECGIDLMTQQNYTVP
ncbi:MAG: MBL fold metallo-hydrolase [Gammaproteobacteria bacterium]|nr:MBL fold metallo-hydrolase [Gammaproteobacteria bacterium]MCF6363494.1 MBL fold metallo-hydrolase [Gammaproteobacteria bacterium]